MVRISRHNMTPEQFAAMFSQQEIRRGISSRDIDVRLKDFGITTKKPLTPQEEFKKTDLVKEVAPTERRVFTEAERDVFLPPTRKEVITRPKVITVMTEKGIVEKIQPSERITIRKRKFGPKEPGEEATEAQKEALLRATGRSQTQTTSGEAFQQFTQLRQQRIMDLVKALQGNRSTDPFVQSEVNRLTPEQRVEAVEMINRKATFGGGIGSPLFISGRDLFNILRRVKPR